jgi:hypothetical protein
MGKQRFIRAGKSCFVDRVDRRSLFDIHAAFVPDDDIAF